MTDRGEPIPPGLRKEMTHAAQRVGALDWLMLLLAVLSVGLLAWDLWFPLDDATRRSIVIADYAICAIFAAEFVWRWGEAGWTLDHVRRNWYDVLGMIPLQHPAVRGLRLFRALRIAILLSRFGRAADRAMGEEFTYRLVERFKGAIVDSISDAVTVAVLDEVSDVLSRGQFARNVGRALEENGKDLRAMIEEKLRDDPQAGRFARWPFAREMTQTVVETAFRVIEEVLKDPRTDELIADVLRENLQQIRASVQLKAAAESRS